MVDGQRRVVASHYTLAGRRIGVSVGAYDRGLPLTVDPVLSYSTYLEGVEMGTSIAVDTVGNAYVTGSTGSGSDFPAGAAQSTSSGHPDAFVAKLDPAGSALIYATYLGGTDNDVGYGITLDVSGNAYVTGQTSSLDFPTRPGAAQSAYGGGLSDAFVAKLNPSGTALSYSTYLGDSELDAGSGIGVDASGNAYVRGSVYMGTSSTFDFPTTPGAIQPVFRGASRTPSWPGSTPPAQPSPIPPTWAVMPMTGARASPWMLRATPT